MDNFKIGDFVYFSLDNKNTDKLYKCSGIIINVSDNVASILDRAYNSTIYNIDFNNIRPVSDRENIIDEIYEFYNKQIINHESKIKSVKRGDYEDEIVEKYCNLKQEIINTAKHMIEAKDDEDFENKLKAICARKKEIFAIECEEIVYARKDNGAIKYKIKELEKSRDNSIANLDKSIDNIKKAFERI